MKVIGWFELYNDWDDIVVEYVPYFDMAEWLEEQKENQDADETCHNAMDQVHRMVRQGDYA